MADPHTHFDTAIRVALFALFALLIILCGLLFHQYRVLREELSASGHLPRLFIVHGNATHLTDVDLIQPWMTYDYINHVYGLPADYLKDTLVIADPRYPRVSISESAEAQHEDAAALTAQVKTAVSHYLVTNGT
jgi:hypothetical protein